MGRFERYDGGSVDLEDVFLEKFPVYAIEEESVRAPTECMDAA